MVKKLFLRSKKIIRGFEKGFFVFYNQQNKGEIWEFLDVQYKRAELIDVLGEVRVGDKEVLV